MNKKTLRVGMLGFGRTGRAVATVLFNTPHVELEWVARRSVGGRHRSVAEVLGVDIEEESVRVAKRHQEMNDIAASKTGLRFIAGNGFAAPDMQTSGPFDLIIANILAGPLVEMAPACAAIADEKSCLILSGLLKVQADDVLKAYEKEHFSLQTRFDIGEWATLLLKKL